MAELPSKLFFRIGEVASLVGVEPHVLRYWEREFRSIRPTKSAKGQRVYSRKDVESLLRVRDLLYRDGFTIAGARKKLSTRAADAADATVSADATEAAEGTNAKDVDLAPASAIGQAIKVIEAVPAFAPSQGAATAALSAEQAHVLADDVLSSRVAGDLRTTLMSLRAEVAGFLAELTGAPPRAD
jgi:DNA-binding transcriptional MerR regulator